MDLDNFVAEMASYEKPRMVDPHNYFDPTVRETLHRLKELGVYEKPRIKSILDLFPAVKDMEDSTRDVMKRAHEIASEMAVEPPGALQRRVIIDKLSEQNELLSKQHKQDKEQIEMQKQEIDLLKKTLESLGILPSMDNNLNKIAKQAEKDAIPEKLGYMIGALMGEFDQFKKDYDVLLEHRFFEIDEKNEKLVSQYGKPFIYDYFKFIKDKNQGWKAIENVFGEQNLRRSWGDRKNLSMGMEKWAEFQRIDKSIIEGKVFPQPI
jgi:hypothetical protein